MYAGQGTKLLWILSIEPENYGIDETPVIQYLKCVWDCYKANSCTGSIKKLVVELRI